MQRGVTLLELLVVMGIAAILFSLTTIHLVNFQQNTSISTQTESLISDIKGQQIKAMNGVDSFGIFLQADKYVLFKGSSYNAGDPSNFPVTLNGNLSISSSFANNIIVFSATSGEVANFSPLGNTVTLTNTAGGETKILTVNRFGVVTNIQ